MQSKQHVASVQSNSNPDQLARTDSQQVGWRGLLSRTFIKPQLDQRLSTQRELAITNALPQPDSFEKLSQAVIDQSKNQPDSHAQRLALRNIGERLVQNPKLRANLSGDVIAAVTSIFERAESEFALQAKQGLGVREEEFQARTTDAAAALMESMQNCALILGRDTRSLPHQQLAKLCMRAAQLEINDASNKAEYVEFKVISANLALRYVQAARNALCAGEISANEAIDRYLNRVDQKARRCAKIGESSPQN